MLHLLSEKTPGATLVRAAFVVDLQRLRILMHEYLAEQGGEDDLMQQLTLSSFITWLQRKEKINEQKSDNESTGAVP